VIQVQLLVGVLEYLNLREAEGGPMNTKNLQRQFARIGARVTVNRTPASFSLDVRRGRMGSMFEINLGGSDTQVSVLDVQPRQRHLVLRFAGSSAFLCGHDERDWFAAAVPDGGVTSVRAAMEALKPHEVRLAQVQKRVKRQRRNRRRNAAFIRQGEWFFLPAPELAVNVLTVLHNEPLSRGRGKPHMAEQLVRAGGEAIYVCREYPRGLTEEAYRRLIVKRPTKAQLAWRIQRRNPLVYVRGSVRHPDHKTIHLDVWHRVLPNTEHKSAAMSHLAFID
jgi:hypothetical protein